MEAERPARETILVVDDEPAVLELVKDALEAEGYTVVTAVDPLVAKRMAAAQPVQLLLTDVVMPAMSGIELAERVEAASPGTKVLLMSGYMTEAMRTSGRRILSKPFGVDALLTAVRETLDRRSAFQRPGPR